MSQLPLQLMLPEVLSADNFFISGCNEEAYEILINERNWENNAQKHALYLYGEKGSGKSHMAHIWKEREGAAIIPVNNIKPASVNGNSIIEDVEKCTDEEALLHLFNHCKDIGVKLLITSSFPVSSLPFTLPDLTSRLRGLQVATIYPPDDALIAGVMRKQFADRQLLVDDEVISYLVTHTERTLENVKILVEKLDRNALSEKRRITVPFVRKVFG
ncbi:MAG: hypothetical protein ABL867_11410 [Rickettsiales bacterium]